MFWRRKRQLVQALELIEQYDRAFKEVHELAQKTLVLLSEASQQRDEACETSDRIRTLLSQVTEERDLLLAGTKSWKLWRA